MQDRMLKITLVIMICMFTVGMAAAVSIGAIEVIAASHRPDSRLEVAAVTRGQEERYRTLPAHTKVVNREGALRAYRRDAKALTELLRQDAELHGGRLILQDRQQLVRLVIPEGYVDRLRPLLDEPELGRTPAYRLWAEHNALTRDPQAADGELTLMHIRIRSTSMPTRALHDAQTIAVMCAIVLPIVAIMGGGGVAISLLESMAAKSGTPGQASNSA